MTMRRLVGVFLFVLVPSILFVSSCRQNSASKAAASKAVYYCPMHTTYVSDKPGDCPICGMRLVARESAESSKDTVASNGENPTREKKPLFYRHPMQPNVTSPVPMKDEMGMDYVPVYADQGTDAVINGRTAVKIPADRARLIGVRTARVEKRDLEILVRASGRVAYDPDLYNAIIEYQEAVKSQAKEKESPWPDVHERSEALVNSARLRLRQLGLSDDQIENLGRDFGNPTSLLIGKAGDTIWVYSQVYEYEVGLIKAGQKVEATAPAFPGQQFEGTVVAVDSILNAATRTLRVRSRFPNPDGSFRPEMFINTVIHVRLGHHLAIPEEALTDTGTRQIVFVKTGDGSFEPRVIRTGHEAEGYLEVLSGLIEGETVVVSGNFLIDSESKLKAAVSQAAKP